VRATVVGWQGILDLHGCEEPQFDDLGWVRATMLDAARRAQATIIMDRFHRFAPQGISGVVVIAESHLAIHTWPERRFVAIDVFTCSTKTNVRAAMDYLVEAFRPLRNEFALIERGGPRITVQRT
jgi:S-adenosylmethionine decarboxylase proenzyme